MVDSQPIERRDTRDEGNAGGKQDGTALRDVEDPKPRRKSAPKRDGHGGDVEPDQDRPFLVTAQRR
jgi:hypothetical protein